MLGDAARGESNQGLGLYWRMEKQVRKLEAASGSVVGATGALYAVRRELLTRVPPETILDDVVLAHAGGAAGQAGGFGRTSAGMGRPEPGDVHGNSRARFAP